MNIRDDFKQDPKRILWCGIAILTLITGYFYQGSAKQQKRDDEIAYQRQLQTLTLPTGVELAWMQYIDRRLNEEIQREGNTLKVRKTYIGSKPSYSYSYVSLSYPYQIDCDTFALGITIDFGNNDESSFTTSLTGPFSADHGNEPELGVHRESLAAKSLDQKLCSKVANWLSQQTSR